METDSHGVAEVNIFKDASSPETQIPLLDRLWQAECRLERSYARAQRELQRLQTSRPQPDPQPEEAAPAAEPPVVGHAVSPAGQAATAPSATPPAPGTLTELETETTDGFGSMETSR